MSARVLAAAAGGAVALAAGATWLVVASNHEGNPAATLAFALTAGLSFVGSGLIALWRRPENFTGILLVAVGYLWFLGALAESNNDWVFTAGIALNSVVFGAFVHLLLAFPWGRLGSPRDVYLVAATYALVILGSLAHLMVDERPVPDCAGCLSTLAVTDDPTAQTAVRLTVTGLALVLLGAILATVRRRFVRSSPALRRVLGPVIATGAIAMLVVVVQLVVDVFSERAAEPLEFVFLAAFAAVPFAFLAGVLRARLARSAVGELLLDLAAGGASLRDALARALHDPSLDIVYWLPKRGIFVWHDGNPFVDEGGPRTARYVEHDGERVAALLHDPSLADEPELVDAVAAAAGLWLANEQLQAELRAQYDFLETIVNTAPSLLMSVDLEGRIANFNTACERASGYDEVEELRHQYFWDVLIASDDRAAVRERFLADPEHLPSDYENTFVNRRGEELVIAWSTAPLRDEHGDVRNIICGGLDVTERKRRELELARERDFLRTVADGTPSLLVVVDDAGTIVGNSVNKGFERTIGWTEEEMLGRSFLSLFREDEGYFARLGVASAFNGVEPAERISHWCTRAGGERAIAWTATPIVDSEGRSLALVVGADVTERERRATELRSSEERLRAAIEASPVAIVEYALDDTITRWNAAAERIFGWTAEQVIGGTAKHQPPGREAELAELFRRVRAGEVYTGVESTRVRSDGTSIDVEISAAPIRDSTGKVVSHTALFADITERKRQLHELQASEERLRAAIEASPVAIVEYALDDTITRWNPAAERIFGWTAEQMIGGTPKHRPPGKDDEVAEVFRRIRAGERYTALETKRLRNDGSLIDVEISTASIFDAAGVVVSYMALYADITDRKRQEEEVKASRSRIVAAADDARRMLERNLHDGAQQRLVALSLSLRLAQGRITTDPIATGSILESAREELSLAIEDLRELARGIHPAVLTDRGLEAAVTALAGRSPIPVEVSMPAERLPGTVEAAAYYVVAEALTNVAKYAQASVAHVRVSRDNGGAVVEVADDGIGGADAAAGSGLRGLADRVAALDGTLEVESPTGGGTRILAKLPIADEA